MEDLFGDVGSKKQRVSASERRLKAEIDEMADLFRVLSPEVRDSLLRLARVIHEGKKPRDVIRIGNSGIGVLELSYARGRFNDLTRRSNQ